MNPPDKPVQSTEQLSAPVRKLIDFFEQISEHTVADMPKFYASNAYFKDPFNEVNRVEDIQRILATCSTR